MNHLESFEIKVVFFYLLFYWSDLIVHPFKQNLTLFLQIKIVLQQMYNLSLAHHFKRSKLLYLDFSYFITLNAQVKTKKRV